MESKQSISNLHDLAAALSNVRDQWLLMSLTLTDFIADSDSPEVDEIVKQVEQQIKLIKGADRSAAE